MAHNIWDDWNLLMKKDDKFLESPTTCLYPFINRLRGREKHIELISHINKMFFYTPPRMLMGYLFLSISPDPYCGTPKADRFDDSKYEIVEKYLMQIYKWSKKEAIRQKQVIIKLMESEQFIKQLNDMVCFEKDECKKLGVNYVKYKPKPKDENKQQSASLFSF